MLVASRFNKKGFTLMELLVVIGIITILIAISMVSFWSINQKAKVTADNANLCILNRATQYCAQSSEWK
ncbi:MAG: prepilin-type N-terminal cleavage/methylation domain-containing protein [Anaerotignum sp.]|nr:prepilin-type N-terminal cleavage/methylation domain-containing protein [Anaerotignum sp.]